MNDHSGPPAPIPRHTNILTAFFRNQARWLERLSTGEPTPTLPHPRIRHDETVCTVRTGRSGVMCLDLNDPSSIEDIGAFERSWAWLRSYGAHDALIWSLVDRPQMNLALLARGFEASFRPMWMGRSLMGTLPGASPRNVLVRIATDQDIDDLRVTPAIPYLVPNQVKSTRHLSLHPDNRYVMWLVARDRHGVLGQAIVNLTDDVAGLFNVAVHPDARRRGIGRALTTEAMRYARQHGATRMALNATLDGLGLYQQLGFEHLGDGQTWFLPARRSRMAPNPETVAIAEAIGEGRIDDLDPDRLPSWLPNGDVPMAFAARFKQAETARWLLERGSDADVLALWDIGLFQEAMWSMRDPDVLNRPTGPARATPLHIAVQRGDIPLTELLIAAGARLDTRDAQYQSTPLGWADYLGRPKIAKIIRKAGGR